MCVSLISRDDEPHISRTLEPQSLNEIQAQIQLLLFRMCTTQAVWLLFLFCFSFHACFDGAFECMRVCVSKQNLHFFVLHADNADERRVSITTVIYHRLNAFKQQKAGKRFVNGKNKLCSFFLVIGILSLSFFVVWPGFSTRTVLPNWKSNRENFSELSETVDTRYPMHGIFCTETFFWRQIIRNWCAPLYFLPPPTLPLSFSSAV